MSTPSIEREEITFPSGDEVCGAWLYRPAGAAPHPVVVLAHGLGCVRQQRLDAFAERFQAAGYACLVFDYRHFGSSGGEPRHLLDISRQLDDWDAALEAVRRHRELDSDRIAIWGTSFAGGHVLEIAARNPDVRAVISQCPFTDGLASSLAASPRDSAKVTLRAVADVIGARLGRPPVYVATAGRPGAAALMTAPDALPGIEGITPAGDPTIRHEVAARFGLQIMRYFPGRRAKDIQAPVLFCLCEPDSVAPAKAAQRHAAKAPRGEIRLYPDGHFDIYLGEPFERVTADQVDFLTCHLPTT